MIFYTIFLTTATFAKIQISIYNQDGSNKIFDATPGDCRALSGAPINNVSIPPGLVVKFFNDEGCKGEQLGYGIRDYFHIYNNPSIVRSVKVLEGPKSQPNNPAYYYGHMDYVGRF